MENALYETVDPYLLNHMKSLNWYALNSPVQRHSSPLFAWKNGENLSAILVD